MTRQRPLGLTQAQVDTPAQAIRHRLAASAPGDPMVVVTAMGGGIQAAEWTAQIMAKLETTLREDPELKARHYTLHDHLLLASGVSGGSVGLMPYLLEYTAPRDRQFTTAQGDDGRDLLSARLTAAPACSGLEAVAWGLAYYDLQRALLTFRLPWLQRTYDGAAPDRTWALTQALNRNLNDHDCGTDAFSALPKLRSGAETTLVQAAAALQQGNMPAFTFNTTVAETGDRFLLSNYAVPVNSSSAPLPQNLLRLGSAFLPAESFLQAYSLRDCCGHANGAGTPHADLALVTAARLSATFPVVSSGTRIPKTFAPVASHFLDGGYFDNDGTASVTEFLASALQESKPQPAPLNVLLVEIRDSTDLDPAVNDDDFAHQTGHADSGRAGNAPKPWSIFNQIAAPLNGMWNAGHASTTRRNRRELCLLEQAYKGQGLQIHHVIFGIPAETDKPAIGKNHATYKASPLSWKLTESQKQYIRNWADQAPTRQSIVDAVTWLRKPVPATSAGEACLVHDQIVP